MKTNCRQEVLDLHRFFEGWFAGRLAASDDTFARFSSVLAPHFELVSPDGRASSREEIISRLRTAHGLHATDAGLRIRIERFRVHHEAGDLGLVTYEEWQTIGGRDRGRHSCALFEAEERGPNGVRWVFVHETWLEASNAG